MHLGAVIAALFSALSAGHLQIRGHFPVSSHLDIQMELNYPGANFYEPSAESLRTASTTCRVYQPPVLILGACGLNPYATSLAEDMYPKKRWANIDLPACGLLQNLQTS